ncbi:hypothetical protein Syn7502_00115 [Synechococcus sp. PCC 7502]|uniref:hypothetical protein n=1 Tax=Synechococcus sp. PCC 7502 TaxID=1173263 RepID=UPI00029F8189|nr:hypothetical protein [Synechococcus sp. PCC 7502]AFY72288.1 hypothetical protein Syn7502_00115 [Synechococcus sp. PCC 7502]
MNLPLIIGALAVSFFLMWGLLSILKTSFQTALIVTLIVFGLQMGLKISPQEVFNQISVFIGGIGKWFVKWGTTNKPPSDFPKESLQWLLDSVFNT